MTHDIVRRFGREWRWPSDDVHCRAAAFNQSGDLRVAYTYCKQMGCVVQAGGNMGVWPWLLSKQFDLVVTAEADPRCFDLLEQNIGDTPNIVAIHAGLFSEAGRCGIRDTKPRNLGAQHIKQSVDGAVSMVTIDSLALDACDLIYLDIEGAEMPALLGAKETIRKHRPVIAVEDKGLSTRFGFEKGDIERWLEREFGYLVVARPSKDVVLTCS